MALLKRLVEAEMYETVQNKLDYRLGGRHRDAQRPSPVADILQVDRSMANGRSILEAHFEDRLSVEEIAMRVSLSKRELQRRFQRLLRRSSIDFYREIRLKRALNPLQYSGLTIREIGIAAGIAEPSTFYRAIRERFQEGPQEVWVSFHAGPSVPDGRRTGFND